jgi:hypothetical protein
MTAAAQSTGIGRAIEHNHLHDEDTAPWHKRRNLRALYLLLLPAAIGVEMTSGYDGSVLNGLQAVQPWNDCTFCQYLVLKG